MKKTLAIASILLFSMNSFADTSSATGLTKNSPQLKALGAAWNAQRSSQSLENKDDLTIVYGGPDITRHRIAM